MKNYFVKYGNVVFFVGGFVFDAATLVRIDSLIDLGLQSAYLIVITGFIVLSARYEAGRWRPQGWVAKTWRYESEALHFFYGALLSAYVIFYGSSDFSVGRF